MSTHITTITTDDLTGEEGAREFKFSIEGVHYSVDLTEANRAATLAMLAPLLAVSRRDTGKRAARTARVVSTSRTDSVKVRAWGKDNGFTVADRGRLAHALINAYDNRFKAAAAPAPEIFIDLATPVVPAIEVL